MAKQALGKGLGALISKAANAATATPLASEPTPGEAVRQVALADVVPSPFQPRRDFPKEHLTELMESIREHGIIQPLIVRMVNGKCELIAGERRWRASRELGLAQVPVIVRTASDKDVLELALIENLQREDLNAIEEAQAYERLAREFGLRQEDIAQRVGKNRATVANAMRLLDLPAPVQNLLRDGKLTTGHAKVLLGLKQTEEIESAARTVVDKGLTVRGTEKLVDSLLRPAPPKADASDADVQFHQALKAVEQRMMRHFSTGISLHHGEKKGRIELDYYGVDDLNRLLGMMGVGEEDFGG